MTCEQLLRVALRVPRELIVGAEGRARTRQLPVGSEGGGTRTSKDQTDGLEPLIPFVLPQFSCLAVAEVNTYFCLKAAADFVVCNSTEESCRSLIDLVAASRGISLGARLNCANRDYKYMCETSFGDFIELLQRNLPGLVCP
jgi:hypothetical protein